MSNDDTVAPANGDLETLVAGHSQPLGRREGPLRDGAHAGRYFVLGHIGSGGMGDVYAAYDPKLDRRIALKLMHPSSAKRSEEAGSSSMMREARAMAKVSHANVIVVFDVGMLEDRVFLAMEFVDGCNLKEWLAGERRTWQQIRDVFVLAGSGLAGAHAAGLVHRDFKPANVLVGRDGRVRVADFGLAFGSERKNDSAHAEVEATGPDGSTNSTRMLRTASGASLGTPAYMSPEQHGRVGVDARSDQFSFCVALFEAWFGRRPFGGETFHSLVASVCAGEIEAPPRDSPVPAQLRRALSKGLSVEPEGRFESMNLLLEALAPPKMDRRAVALAVIGVAGLAGAAGWAMLNASGPACDDAEQQLGPVWDGARREAVHLALSESTAPHAAGTTERVLARIDDYAATWRNGYENACAATYVRREQSETAFDLQMVCLAGRRAVLDGLSTALAAGHESAASLATDALQRLPDVADCEDTERLLLGLPPPARPEVRQRLAELEASLHRSIALGDLGAVVDAETLAVEVLDTARVIGYAPFIGRALTQVGAAQAANGKEDLGVETQLAGLEELMAAGADLDVAKAASRLVYTVSQRTHRYEAADIFYRISRAAQRRAGAGEGMRASLLINYGQSLASRGRAEEGLEMVKEGVEICGRIYGLDSLTYARARLSTGPALYDLGRYDELAQTHDEVVAIYHALYGADHPQTLRLLRRTAVVEFVRGEFKVARAQFQRAIVAAERDLGPEHISVVDLRGNLGLVYTALGEFDAAAGELDVVLTRYSQEYGETVGVGEYLINRAAVETARGRMSVAATFLERARTIYAAAPDLGGHLGTVLIELGEVALASGDPILAVQQATRGYKLMLEDYGVDHPRTRAGFIKLLDILIRAGRADLARVQLDGSAALVAEAKRPDLRASLDFVRARLTFAEQPSVAREMAADARNTLALDKYRFVYLRMRQDIDNWLASHE